MKELTYFERTVQGERAGNLRIMYSLKVQYMMPIQREIERFWRGVITNASRFVVHTSDDSPSLPLEALVELQEIYNDWTEISGIIPKAPRLDSEYRDELIKHLPPPPTPSEHPPSFTLR